MPEHLPHVPMLYPAWGMLQEEPGERRFDEYTQIFPELFELVGIHGCDIVLLPFDWRYTRPAWGGKKAELVRDTADRIYEAAQRAGKRMLVFFFSDEEDPVDLENVIVMRPSLSRPAHVGELAMPAFCDDTLGVLLQGNVSLRPHLSRPSVGFCGFAGYTLVPDDSIYLRARSVVRWAYRGFPSLSIRERAIKALRNDPRVETDFLLRDNFFAGLTRTEIAGDEARTAREVFLRNLIGNDYTLTARGGGNFSFRFYESLASGRPPVLIDTKVVLPYESRVPYRELCIWVEEDEVDNVAESIVAFHTGLTPAGFIELQETCRQVWQSFLSPAGFFSHLGGALLS